VMMRSRQYGAAWLPVEAARDQARRLRGDDTRTVRRTTTQPVRSIKAQQHRKTAHVS
jgi:hypothetical protein